MRIAFMKSFENQSTHPKRDRDRYVYLTMQNVMQWELKQFGKNRFGDPLYHMFINGKRERHVYYLNHRFKKAHITCVQNDSGYHKGLYEKIAGFNCALFPDNLQIVLQPIGPASKRLAATCIKRTKNKITIEYIIELKPKDFKQFAWNPLVFCDILESEVRKKGLLPQNFEQLFERFLDAAVAYETDCRGTIGEKTEKGLSLFKKAIAIAHKKMKAKTKSTLALLSD